MMIRSNPPLAAGFLFCAAALTVAASTSPPDPQAPGTSAAAPGHAVLVELFTSQGCSSCPPADRLLSTIVAENGGRVIALEFHVDFWNSGGWKDPFSEKEWTQRQIGYERVLGLSQVYTPQAVVDGGTEMVGSDAQRLRGAIDSAAARPAGQIDLRLEPSGSRVKVAADVTLPDALRGQGLDLVLVVFERNLTTAVGRGENGGQTLHNDYVVRSLERAGKLSANGPSTSHHEETLRLSKDWDASRLGVAAFLQDPKSLVVHGAAAVSLTSAADPVPTTSSGAR
jgi:hypothetical protein